MIALSKWKSSGLIGVTVLIAVLLAASSLISLIQRSYADWASFVPLAALAVLTALSVQFAVFVPNIDGTGQSRKAVSDTFIFLAAMMYAVPPLPTVAPATTIAAIAALALSRSVDSRYRVALRTAFAIISTYVAASVFALLVSLFTSAAPGTEHSLGALLFPLCVMALVYHFVNIVMEGAYAADHGVGDALRMSQQNLFWTAITATSGIACAALFYAAWRGGGVAFVFIGLLIVGLVYLLYQFNEQRVGEIQRSEEEKRLHANEMAELHLSTVESLAIAIDAKDHTTHGHVRRTQLYATELGRLLGVSEGETQALKAGALLHDIGKLAVPEYILNKPGKLTEAEFARMKIHPTVGGDILRRVNFPYPVEDVVRFHHEKWDGSGYPNGLKGEGIPLVARIISVVDFYDATRCDRPYRAGMKRVESLGLLQSMAGTSFDPNVVAMFVMNIEEFDRMIEAQDRREQVTPVEPEHTVESAAVPDAGLEQELPGEPADNSGFRSIADAHREVAALHDIAQSIGSSLNLQDTVTFIANKLGSIVPFDTCIIFLVDEQTGKAVPAHIAGKNADAFARRRITIGDGVTGWVIAHGRSMSNTTPGLDLVGVPESIASQIGSVLVSPLLREDGAFGAITLYSDGKNAFTSENARLLESVALHASTALNNAITYEKTKERALIDPLTELPNARAFYMTLEQRIAECQRLKNREPMTVVSMNLDNFKDINEEYGHAVGDQILSGVSRVIRKQLRQMDILARYAGDEFIAILPMASAKMAIVIAERVAAAVEAHRFAVLPKETACLGVSIGIACYPEDGDTAEQLLAASERNMKHDKDARKFQPLTTSDGNQGIGGRV